MKPTFKEQFDKLTQAYIRNEVNPYSACNCFVGNLHNNDGKWREHSITEEAQYSFYEVTQMEKTFMETILDLTLGSDYNSSHRYFLNEKERERVRNHPNYEEALFIAFEKTLEELKEIHIERGENVEEVVFTKRVLEPVSL